MEKRASGCHSVLCCTYPILRSKYEVGSVLVAEVTNAVPYDNGYIESNCTILGTRLLLLTATIPTNACRDEVGGANLDDKTRNGVNKVSGAASQLVASYHLRRWSVSFTSDSRAHGRRYGVGKTSRRRLTFSEYSHLVAPRTLPDG